MDNMYGCKECGNVIVDSMANSVNVVKHPEKNDPTSPANVYTIEGFKCPGCEREDVELHQL